jgi:hypothetical protein
LSTRSPKKNTVGKLKSRNKNKKKTYKKARKTRDVGYCGPSWAFVGVVWAKGVVGVMQPADSDEPHEVVICAQPHIPLCMKW